MTAIWHVAWKEYRLLRGLWIAMVAIALMLQMVVMVAVDRADISPRDFATDMFALTIWLPAFYALGCGATMFAAEKDDGTFELLRTLPVNGLRVLAGKLLYALPSTALLFAALFLLTRAFNRGVWPQEDTLRLLWGAWLVAALEALAWGIFVSLLSKRPLQSAVIAAALGSTVTHLVVDVYVNKFWELESYTAALPWRLAVVGVVFLVDVLLARGWLANERVVKRAMPRNWSWIRERTDALSERAPRTRWVRLKRLWWQESRQSWRAVTVCIAIASVAGSLTYQFPTSRQSTLPGALLAAALLSAFLCALLGAMTFRGDHEERRYRFLAELAVPPGNIWWARELFWGAAALLCGAICVVSALSWNHTLLAKYPTVYEPAPSLGIATAVFRFVLLPFVAGQFASLLLRSPLLAATFGLVIAAALIAWETLMASVSIASWWSVLPLAIALLVATRIRLPEWLLERNAYRAWARFAAVLLLPTALIVSGVIAFRVYEVPSVVNGVSLAKEPFDVAAYLAPATPEELETAEMYRQVELPDWTEFPPAKMQEPPESLQPASDPVELSPGIFGISGNPGEPPEIEPTRNEIRSLRNAFLTKHADSLKLLLAATQRDSCLLRNPNTAELDRMPEVAVRATEFDIMIRIAADEAEAEGQPDIALDHHLRGYRLARHVAHRGTYAQCWQAFQLQQRTHDAIARWAQRPGKTRELLERALAEYRRVCGGPDIFVDGPKTTYVVCRHIIEIGDASNAIQAEGRDGFLVPFQAKRFPWERARQMRLLNLVTYWSENGSSQSSGVFPASTLRYLLRRDPLSADVPQAVRQLVGTSPSDAMLAWQMSMVTDPLDVAWLGDVQSIINDAIARLDGASRESVE